MILFFSQHACLVFFFFNGTATTEIYTLSLHDALPISESIDMLVAIGIFLFTIVLVIWQPKGLGVGWSAKIGRAHV